MNIIALQTFLSVVENGSLVRASQKLNVTQSTVTARLKTLEDELGQILLNRYKSGTTLTPAGTRLLRYAETMTGLWRQAKSETNLPAGLNAVCTFGCDRELWHGSGRAFFNGVAAGHPDMAISVRQGGGSDLEVWLASGTVDVILSFDAVARGSQTVYALPAEELVLYSSRRNTPIKGDPFYVFVDHGEEYRREHANHYHDAGVARLSFDSSWWALRHMLDTAASAYLPRALALDYVAAGDIFPISGAPVFARKKNLVVADSAARNWTWFADLIETLR